MVRLYLILAGDVRSMTPGHGSLYIIPGRANIEMTHAVLPALWGKGEFVRIACITWLY